MPFQYAGWLWPLGHTVPARNGMALLATRLVFRFDA
jgi:hypothetical protein